LESFAFKLTGRQGSRHSSTTEGDVQALAELWAFATAWYNLPFSLALLAFLGLSAVQFIGLEQDHGTDADAHADFDHDMSVDHDLGVDHDLSVDHDVSVEHDLAVEHDADLGHDVDHDLDHDVDHDVEHDVSHEVGHDAGGAPAWIGVLRFLGVGQAPLTMVLLVLLGGFGILGWVANASVMGILPKYPAWALAVVLLLDLFVAAWFTSRVAVFIGRAVPAFSSTATSVKRLVSRRGHVVSPQVDEKYGQVKVRDQGGTLITVFAVVDPGKPPIPRDTEVILVEYDEARKRYVVVPSDL
jgi:membrane protein implicated in regulation of membrane protease activity